MAYTRFPKLFYGRYIRSEQYNFNPGQAVYCTIEELDGRLYVAERVDSRAGGRARSELVISEMDPETCMLLGKKTLWIRPDKYVYFGVIDSCVYQGKIWLTFTTATRWGVGLGCEDTWIMWFDPRSGEKGEPVKVCPDKNSGCSNMTVWRGKIWISYNAGSRWQGDSHLCLRSFDGSTFGPEHLWDGHKSVYHPAVSVFNDHLYIHYGESSMFGIDKESDSLFMVEFDGGEFFNCRRFYSQGRNAYVHATEYDERLWMFWKSTGRTYKRYGYDYQDIAMMYMERDGTLSGREYLIEENTYNSGPVPCLFRDRLYIVYTKYTRYYHSESGPSKWVGDWVVTLTKVR